MTTNAEWSERLSGYVRQDDGSALSQLHRHVYNAMRGTPGNEGMPHWDDLPEFVRPAMLAVERAEREACAKIADESAVTDRKAKGFEKDPHMRDIIQDCVITAAAIAAAIRNRK